jgi:hypothetical protein
VRVTAIDIYEHDALPAQHQPNQYETLWRLAQRVSGTEFVPASFRGKPEAVMAAFVSGAEIGCGPMKSLRIFQSIQGSVGLKPEAMRAVVAQAGHLIETTEFSNERVTLHGKRGDTGQEETVTWTMDDAKRAQLDKGANWAKYPRAMLLARATSELCRLMFSDITLGLAYNADELEEMAQPTRPLSHSRALPPSDVDTATGEVVERPSPAVAKEKIAEARSTIRRAPGRKAPQSDAAVEASGEEDRAKDAVGVEPAEAAGGKPAADAEQRVTTEQRKALVDRVAALPDEFRAIARKEWKLAGLPPLSAGFLAPSDLPKVEELLAVVEAEAAARTA